MEPEENTRQVAGARQYFLEEFSAKLDKIPMGNVAQLTALVDQYWGRLPEGHMEAFLNELPEPLRKTVIGNNTDADKPSDSQVVIGVMLDALEREFIQNVREAMKTNDWKKISDLVAEQRPLLGEPRMRELVEQFPRDWWDILRRIIDPEPLPKKPASKPPSKWDLFSVDPEIEQRAKEHFYPTQRRSYRPIVIAAAAILVLVGVFLLGRLT